MLDEQIALVIALLIDPEAALKEREPSRVSPAAPIRVVERVVEPAPPPPPPKPWRESLAVGPGTSFGLLPSFVAGIKLRGEITPPSLFPFEIGGAVWIGGTAHVPGASAARGASVSLSYGMLGVCPLAWSSGGSRILGCTDLEVGSIRAMGYGFTAQDGPGGEQPIVLVAIGGRVFHRLVGPLEVGLGLDLEVPLRGARFYYIDSNHQKQDLFVTSGVAGRMDASLGIAFP